MSLRPIWIRPTKRWVLKAKQALRRAIAIYPDQADAHAALAGMSFFRERELAVSERQYKRAIDLDPHNAFPIREYSDLLRITGRSEQARTEINGRSLWRPTMHACVPSGRCCSMTLGAVKKRLAKRSWRWPNVRAL